MAHCVVVLAEKNGGSFAKWVKWVPKREFNSNIGEVLWPSKEGT